MRPPRGHVCVFVASAGCSSSLFYDARIAEGRRLTLFMLCFARYVVDLQAPWLQQRWSSSDAARVRASASTSGVRNAGRKGGVRMVAEVPAIDDRVKAVMEAEAAADADSKVDRQGIRSLAQRLI